MLLFALPSNYPEIMMSCTVTKEDTFAMTKRTQPTEA